MTALPRSQSQPSKVDWQRTKPCRPTLDALQALKAQLGPTSSRLPEASNTLTSGLATRCRSGAASEAQERRAIEKQSETTAQGRCLAAVGLPVSRSGGTRLSNW